MNRMPTILAFHAGPYRRGLGDPVRHRRGRSSRRSRSLRFRRMWRVSQAQEKRKPPVEPPPEPEKKRPPIQPPARDPKPEPIKDPPVPPPPGKKPDDDPTPIGDPPDKTGEPMRVARCWSGRTFSSGRVSRLRRREGATEAAGSGVPLVRMMIED